MVNKKGWIKVLEASIAVLLVAGVIIFMIKSMDFNRDRQVSEIYNAEEDILRNIELNSSMRNEVLKTSGSVEWRDFPNSIKNLVAEKKPLRHECAGKICSPEDSCMIERIETNNIYTQSVIITSNLTIYNPRVIKIFCWER